MKPLPKRLVALLDQYKDTLINHAWQSDCGSEQDARTAKAYFEHAECQLTKYLKRKLS